MSIFVCKAQASVSKYLFQTHCVFSSSIDSLRSFVDYAKSKQWYEEMDTTCMSNWSSSFSKYLNFSRLNEPPDLVDTGWFTQQYELWMLPGQSI